MITNYLRMAVRALRQRPGYAVINTLGLAVGMASALLIGLYVLNQTGYDSHHEQADRIYRVALERSYPDRSTTYAVIPTAVAPQLEETLPEVEETVRLFSPPFAVTIRVGDRQFRERRAMFADSTFFAVFSVPLLEGRPESALTNPNGVVLSASTARRYFGDAGALGKTISVGDDDFEVTGVAQDMPERSHFHFDLLRPLSWVTSRFLDPDSWISFSVHSYLLLNPGASPGSVEEKLPELIQRYAGAQIEARLGTSFADYLGAGNGYRYFLQPLTSIYLHSNLEAELEPTGNATYIQILGAVALFILLLACINFVNLSTAQSTRRAREVGVRKALGSQRSDLIVQFLSESCLLSGLALVVGLALVTATQPFFNAIVGKDLGIDYFGSPWTLPALVGFALAIGIAAGSYPAFLLSRFRPSMVLRGTTRNLLFGARLRNGLIVLQFAISVVLLVGTAVVYTQLQYAQSRKLGFEHEGVIVVNDAWHLEDQFPAFLQELERGATITEAAASSTIPGGTFPGAMLQRVGATEATDNLTGRQMTVTPSFLPALGIDVVDGRNFAREFASDTTGALFNREAIRELGLSDPIGQEVTFLSGPEPRRLTILGIVEDFHFQSLHQQIRPLVLFAAPPGQTLSFVLVRFRTSELEATMETIAETWRRFVPSQPVATTFLDDNLRALYQQERDTGNVAGSFSLIALLIACLGLYGLASFIAEQRTREIGVRKAVGAPVRSIVVLLSKDFLRPVLIAFALAAPVAYWGASQWLQRFAYSVDLGVGLFAAAGALVLVIALATVGGQAYRAARLDPAHALHSE